MEAWINPLHQASVQGPMGGQLHLGYNIVLPHPASPLIPLPTLISELITSM